MRPPSLTLPGKAKYLEYPVMAVTAGAVIALVGVTGTALAIPSSGNLVQVGTGGAAGELIMILKRRGVFRWIADVVTARASDWRAACATGDIRVLTGLAGLLAGHRHAHLREAWAADLYGDPDSGEIPTASRRLRLAAGFIVAAAWCRLDDAAELAWRPADALLASWHGSRLAMTVPVTVAVGLVLTRDGFYGLIANAGNLGVIAGAPYAAIKGLRHYRQIDTPKRPAKKGPGEKASPADGPGQRPA